MSDAGTNGGQQVLPLYVIGDESLSMQGEPLDSLNRGLVEIRDEVSLMPTVREKVRFSVLSFSNGAQARLELTAITEDVEIPPLVAQGGTNYASAFQALYDRLPQDVNNLKSQGFGVHRPAVFFLSDGFPTDGDWQNGDTGESVWGPVLARLHDKSFNERPNILAFGIGDANPKVIAKVASKKGWAFMAEGGVSPGDAIKEFIGALLHSMITSGQAMAEGAPLLVKQPEGFVVIENETI